MKFKSIINNLFSHMAIVFLPFIMYEFFKVYLSGNTTNQEITIFVSFFFFCQLISCCYFVVYQTEKLREHANNIGGRIRFFMHILGLVFFLVLSFASYYWCLFDFNKVSFSKVDNENPYFDFFFFSFGIFVMNNLSDIKPISLIAKLFVCLEMLTAFISLVLILANFKDLKSNLIKEMK